MVVLLLLYGDIPERSEVLFTTAPFCLGIINWLTGLLLWSSTLPLIMLLLFFQISSGALFIQSASNLFKVISLS
jgi:hypothetical protein